MSDAVVFDESLYSLAAVQRAAERYGSLARIQLSREAGRITATIADINAEMTEFLVDEFCNDALHETVVAQRRAESASDEEVGS